MEEAEADVMDFLRESGVDLAGIDPQAAHMALAAFSRYPDTAKEFTPPN